MRTIGVTINISSWDIFVFGVSIGFGYAVGKYVSKKVRERFEKK